MREKIALGSKVKDTITGFEGVATGRAEYLHAPASMLVEGHVTDPGKTAPTGWIEESRLEVIVPA